MYIIEKDKLETYYEGERKFSEVLKELEKISLLIPHPKLLILKDKKGLNFLYFKLNPLLKDNWMSEMAGVRKFVKSLFPEMAEFKRDTTYLVYYDAKPSVRKKLDDSIKRGSDRINLSVSDFDYGIECLFDNFLIKPSYTSRNGNKIYFIL